MSVGGKGQNGGFAGAFSLAKIKENGKVTIDFVGDINFDPRWYTMEYAKKQGGIASCISEDLLKELKSADITMVNNEFCYTREKKTQEGKFQ